MEKLLAFSPGERLMTTVNGVPRVFTVAQDGTFREDGSEHVVADLVRKLDDGVSKGHNGYVARPPEVIAILQNLSPLVPASIVDDRYYPAGSDSIGVRITVGFALERSLL